MDYPQVRRDNTIKVWNNIKSEKPEQAYQAARILDILDYPLKRLPELTRMVKAMEQRWRREEEGIQQPGEGPDLFHDADTVTDWQMAWIMYILGLKLPDMPFVCAMYIQLDIMKLINEMAAEDPDMSEEQLTREKDALATEEDMLALRREIESIAIMP